MIFNESDKALVRDILTDQRKYLHCFNMRKPGSNKVRPITAPSDTYLELQQKILDWMSTMNLFPISETAYGWIKGKSSHKCAELHTRKRYLLEADISSFFDNISHRVVLNKFRELKLNKIDKLLLEGELRNLGITIEELVDILTIPLGPGSKKRKVPQGFKTSGYLANLVRYPIDCHLEQVCREKGWTYSTYGDNIFISGTDVNKPMLFYISKLLEKHGFKMNVKKSKVTPYYKRQMVLGFVVNEKVTIPKDYYFKTLHSLIDSEELDGRLKGQSNYVIYNDVSASRNRYMKQTFNKVIHGPSDV